jgi:hypothetical protein
MTLNVNASKVRETVCAFCVFSFGPKDGINQPRPFQFALLRTAVSNNQLPPIRSRGVAAVETEIVGDSVVIITQLEAQADLGSENDLDVLLRSKCKRQSGKWAEKMSLK